MAKHARSKTGRVETGSRRPDRSREKPASSSSAAATSNATPAPIVPQSHIQAVELFQRGMESLQKHAYKAASESFKAILDRFPTERVVAERSRLYLELSERELKRRPADPRTIEERLTAATAALNSGDDVLAERFAQSVLAEDSKQDLALYLMAAIEARRGEAEAAV